MAANPFSEHILLDIVSAASTIDERLGDNFYTDGAQLCNEVVNARLEMWCNVVSKGDWDRFYRRLAWDDLDVETVRKILGEVRIREGCSLPAWAEVLRKVLDPSNDASGAEARKGLVEENLFPFFDPEQPLPFEEVLVSFAVVATQELAARSGPAYHLLSERALALLQRSLLQTLISNAAQALYLEFSIERAREQSGLERMMGQIRDDNTATLYRRFVQRMRHGGLVDFFREYPVLARLLATITAFWADANAEFLQRLSTDWPDIRRVFGANSCVPELVTDIQTSLSDPHRGRRSVIVFTFGSGRKLVYKPKDLGTEEAYQRLLAWFNERGVPLPFKVLKVLNCSSHGWVEFVEHQSCQDQEEIRRYYQRAGILLCLVYALEGTDCHYENIIADGEHPILVDMETLLHHWPCFEEIDVDRWAEFQAQEQLMRSVLRTGFLPSWQVHGDHWKAYDLSGLGEVSEQELPIFSPKWEHINTDRMTLVSKPFRFQKKANVPLLRGASVGLQEYVRDIVSGFQQMYHFLLTQREELLAAESPLSVMARQQVRFIYRNTWVYGSLTRQLLNPRYLRDGVSWSIQLELLCRAVLPVEGPLRDREEPSRWWPLFAAERWAMEQGDIPFFTARADDDTLLVTPDWTIEGCLQESGFDLVVARLRGLDDLDLERQIGFIMGSLYAHVAREVISVGTERLLDVNASVASTNFPTSTELITQALGIAEQIAARAIRAADGSATWITPQYLVQVERYQFQPMNYDLYSGSCGVALFLAAIAKITSNSEYHKLALGTLQPLRRALRQYEQSVVRALGIGGGAGLASVIYTLTRIGQWLDEPSLLEDARQAASFITTDGICRDEALDIMQGTAGAMLGLLSLYEASLDEAILDQALACGRRLLQARVESESSYRSWPTLERKLLAGFSHGAAGIIYALLRLYTFTGERDLLAAAEEGIAYENTIFAPDAGNWLDLRGEKQPAFTTSWCHGAPGIGLSRIGGLPVLDTRQIREDIEIALETTLTCTGKQDHLCCGEMGRVEILLTASDRLSRPDLAETARRRAWDVVRRAQDAGAFLLHPLLPRQVYVPGFFQGTAGIGYTLLRLAQPERLPTVLLWE